MSRIGRMPIPLPPGVSVEIQGSQVTVRGPKGTLTRTFDPDMRIVLEDKTLRVYRPTDSRRHRALHGLTRALLANMVAGVSQGYQKQLEIRGVGYRAERQADGSLVMYLGFSHPVRVRPPEGITFEVDPKTNVITVRGIDKELVGRVAAEIRAWRPADPYLGKGLRYLGEQIRQKAGKAGKAGKGGKGKGKK
ncbi:MAG: 50S ribosomal protein L6 [Anaerolineae bacterium]|nr:50S ribosomal protein L6 [Anaerolineae bacterium]MCX8067610.1 50S ribosomal protein L6 [Anaerolineae bacterium]MDW7991884.1 50S ribosomal protein L6 [Anaerolineae bacterium]